MVGVMLATIGRGISRTISMSNTIKINASRKKRSENGIRAVFLGSVIERVARTHAAMKTTITRMEAIIINRMEAVINWGYIIFFLIKSQVLNFVQAPQLDTGSFP